LLSSLSFSLSFKDHVFKRKSLYYIVIVGFLEGIQLDAYVQTTFFLPRSPRI